MTEKAKCKYCTDEIDGSGDICEHCARSIANVKRHRKFRRNRHAWGFLFWLTCLLFFSYKVLMDDYVASVPYLICFAVIALGYQIQQFFVWARFVREEYDPWDGMADELNKES